MDIKTYSEIVSGDVGAFTDGSVWVACGPFEPVGHLDSSGRTWGSFPIVSNEQLKKDRTGWIQGCADTTTKVFTLT